MPTVAVTVFSKNRPMQLDCTLRSLKANAPKPDFLSVIWKATSDGYAKGYAAMKGVGMVQEGDFKKDVMDSIRGDYTMFLTDDDIVFKRMEFVAFGGDVACFSYRLGQNIDFCYPMDRGCILRNGMLDGEFLKWDWTREELDFAYPLSVTSHLFRSDVIRDLTGRIGFSNPNEYEAALQSQLHRLPNMMESYRDSRIVGVPANRVNDYSMNRNGLTHGYTTDELNSRFLSGETIDFTRMGFLVRSAQQELEYKFINNNK